MKDTLKKKRVSKKSKLSWRKHVDISDVENFLEDKRLEERLGKPVSEKTNQELFLIDVAPTTRKTVTSKQKRRLLLKNSTPKCFSMLQPHTEVPAIITKRNCLNTTSLQSVIEKKLQKNIKKDKKLPMYTMSRLKKLNKLKSRKHKLINFNNDMWNCEVLDQIDGDWMNDNTKKHTLKGLGQFRVKIPHLIHTKPSILPSIEIPHPGISYNPKLEDHQAILKEAVKREEKLIKEEAHLNRVTTDVFQKTSATERDSNWIIEMSEGLENEDDEFDTVYKSINPPVQNKKKDLKQRRKHREHQKLLGEIKLIKKEKKKITDIHNLKILKDEIDKQNKKTALLQTKRIKKKEHTHLKPKRLSNRKFEEKEFDFNLPQNISGNLRNLRKEGSILVDRFKSFERRNILRPSAKYTSKKGKFKKFIKPGHKEDWKTTVARPNILQLA